MQEGGVRHGGPAYRALGIALVALALAGCGDDAVTVAPMTPGPTALVVREYDGERLTETTTLDCAVRGGPCDAMVALVPRLAPDAGEVCTQIYGGPERRVISGTIEGLPVDVEVTRANGCEIARYDMVTAALRP